MGDTQTLGRLLLWVFSLGYFGGPEKRDADRRD